LLEQEQARRLPGRFYADPVGFVTLCYPWGRGSLLKAEGPDKWQTEFLEEIGRQVKERAFNGRDAVRPIRMSTASGHGIGKSTLVAWLVAWIMSTRPHAQGTITANTFAQLQDKTWAQIRKWTALCSTRSLFECTTSRMYHREQPAAWFCSAQTCREENSEAFAGQHAAASTSFYIFDEASAVPDKIFEVAEGGLTDGEPMIFMFGNPTRSSGKFFRTAFGSERNRWTNRSIDSRESALTNKEQIAEWVQDYGEDSDFVRVRVRGLPPRGGDLQFIDSERIFEAQQRAAQSLPDDPLICGVDVARGGSDWNVIRFRRGLDARSIPAQKIPGEQTRNSMVMVSKLAEVLADQRPERRIDAMFIDSALGGPIVNRLQQLGYPNVQEVNFGLQSPDFHQANMRAYMWSRMKDWLLLGAIDSDTTLETDLSGPGYKHNSRDQLLLESKEEMAKRGLASPDHGDALALTFAQHVAPVRNAEPDYFGSPSTDAWMS
jgi:hypothetical protein